MDGLPAERDRPPEALLDASEIADWLRREIATVLEMDPADLDPAASFDSYGLASSDAVFLTGDLSDLLGRELSATLAWDHPTIADLSDLLAKVIRGEAELPDDAIDWDLGAELFDDR
jgi:polyketide synthase 13